MTITAAADGSALGNPGPTGWAWYVNDQCWAAGGQKHGTNNIGELTAVLELLKATAHAGVASEELVILCDSTYVIQSVTTWLPGWKKRGWKKKDGKPVLNVELMQGIDAAMKGRTVRFEWVKGHAGHTMNEAADERARAAATAYQQGKAAEEGPGFNLAGSRGETEVVAAMADANADNTLEESAFTGDHCVAVLDAAAAEKSLWTGNADPLAAVSASATLIDTRARTMSAEAWARGIATLRERNVELEEELETLRISSSLTLVDHTLAAAGSRFRITALWEESAGHLQLIHQHWCVVS